jgi:hypothetical protein
MEGIFSQNVKSSVEVVLILQGNIDSQRIGRMNNSGLPVHVHKLPHGLGVGYYRNEIWNFFHSKKGAWLFGFTFLLFLGFLFFTYNNPLDEIPSYLRLHVIDPDTFRNIYFIHITNIVVG